MSVHGSDSTVWPLRREGKGPGEVEGDTAVRKMRTVYLLPKSIRLAEGR